MYDRAEAKNYEKQIQNIFRCAVWLLKEHDEGYRSAFVEVGIYLEYLILARWHVKLAKPVLILGNQLDEIPIQTRSRQLPPKVQEFSEGNP